MSAPETQGQERRADKLGSLLERLHHPTQLRVFLCAVVLGVGYVAVYMPINNRTTAKLREIEDGRKRLALAEDVRKLRTQFQKVEDRIPKQPDSNEMMQYVLAGIGRSPLKMESFDPSPTQVAGPYQILNLKIRLSGSFADIDRFLEWAEKNERMFRVDNIKISGSRSTKDKDSATLDITLLGLIG